MKILKRSIFHEFKRRVIRRALKRFKGNKTHAAEALGISLRGLRMIMNKKGKW